MFGLATKKEVKKEFDKISEALKQRDATIEKLRDKLETNSLKIATIEGLILVKSHLSQASQSQPVSSSPKPNKETFETKLIQRIKNNKKALVIAEILKLGASMPVNEMFNNIVLERGLCSKASFYRYIESLKSQGLETSEINKETIETPKIKHKLK
jgi:hypothetical protein